MSKGMTIIARHPARAAVLLALALAIALLALVTSRMDTGAVHNAGQVELDGNPAFDGGFGFNPNSGPGDETKCGAAGVDSTNPVQPPSPPDCITTAATYDWADDGNVGNGDQGVCNKDGSNLITDSGTPKGDLRKCIRDFVVASTADTSYHTGSDKDFQEIWDGTTADWGCVKLNNATNKADLLNAGVVKATVTESGAPHEQFYFFAERDSEHGDVFNGFWFLQNPVSSDCPPSTDGDFCPQTSAVDTTCTNPGVHKCGDVLILFNYESGGRIGRVAAYNWQPGLLGCDNTVGGTGLNADCPFPSSLETHDPLCLIVEFTGGSGDCRLTTASDDLCGRVNGETDCATTKQQPIPCFGPGAVTTPWAPGCATPGTNCEGPLASPTYSEAGVDLTGLGIEIPCVAAFVAETRSSPSVTATLKDYALGSFPPCALSWEKRDESATGHPLQGGATFTVTPNPYDGGSLVVSDCTSAPCAAGGDSDPAAGSFSLSNVQPGPYTVCETTAPSGYARDDSLCRSVTVSSANPNETIGTQGTDDCANATASEQDFCNRLGSLEWEKRDGSTSAPHALQGSAQFSVSPNPFACRSGASPGTFTDNAGPDADSDAGQLKLEKVCLGTYTITEETAPSGYAKDTDTTRTCTVSESALTCVVGVQSTDDHADGDSTGSDCSDSALDPNGDECDFHNRLGTIEWEKRSDVDGSLQGGAQFSVSPNPFACRSGASPGTFTDNAGPDVDSDAGQIKLERVCLGTYTITEEVAPSGYAKDPNPTRSITVSASDLNPVVGTQGTADDCPDGGNADTDESDFCNLVGSLFWEKRGKDASTVAAGDELLPGSVFSVTGTGVSFTNITDCTSSPCTAGAGKDQDPDAGQFCLDTMPIGVLLTIDETSTTTGYIQTSPANNGNLTATLSTSSKCSGTPTDAGDFINTPLSKFEIKFICVAFSPSDATKCATQAKITCPTPAITPTPDDSTPSAFDDTDEVYGDGTATLLPGTYNCEIVIDP